MANRIIKFRSWDIDNKEMTYFGLGNVPELYSDKDTVMEYCGLHDCKGKEIYEGDVVESPFSRTIVSLPKFYVWLTEDLKTNDVEIIGNIYEHPSLLTNK